MSRYEPNDPRNIPGHDTVHDEGTPEPGSVLPLYQTGRRRSARRVLATQEQLSPAENAGITVPVQASDPTNEPKNLIHEAAQPLDAPSATPSVNRYTRPPGDEEGYLSGGKAVMPENAVNMPRGKPSALHFDADADTSPRNGENEATPSAPKSGERPNPYARPPADADGSDAWSTRFAPPVKFDSFTAPPPESDLPPAAPNVYRTRRNVDAVTQSQQAANYSVEPDAAALQARRRRKRMLIRVAVILSVVIVLGIAAYLGRNWVFTQLKNIFGEKAVESVQQSVDRTSGTEDAQLTGYDPAPALTVGDKAKKGINAVAGQLGLKAYAVTDTNIIARVANGTDTYDYYLFAASDGKLLGYYEGLPENGFLVCPNNIFYVAVSPYLINAQGRALIDTSRYSQTLGNQPVLGPMINGWALISDAAGTTYNYINADGNALSPLWFSKAFPFTADSTLAYVDTGNVTDPEDRYTLYEMTRSGVMKMWKHAADMSEVLGCANGIACLSDGRLILLDGRQTELTQTDDVSVYADCGAMVVRDPQTGKYGLFVNGARHYDSVYDSIAPVETPDIQWHMEENGLYRQYTVTGMAYPLPLSHYFVLTKGDSEEMVALSTASVYPLLMPLQP